MRIFEKELNWLLAKYSRVDVSMDVANDPKTMVAIRSQLMQEYRRDLPKDISAAIIFEEQMQYKEEIHYTQFLKTVVFKWEPTTTTAELLGGPSDGLIIAQENIQRAYPFKVAVRGDRQAGDIYGNTDSMFQTVPIESFSYHMKGFDLTQNRWIYMP